MRPHWDLWIMNYIFLENQFLFNFYNSLFENNWWFFLPCPVIKKHSHLSSSITYNGFLCCFFFSLCEEPILPKVKSPELHSGTLNGVLYGCIWHHNNGPLQHHISATWPVQTTTCWQCYSTWTWPKVLWFRSKLKLASGCTPRVWLVDLLGHSYHYLLNSDLAQHHSCIYILYYYYYNNYYHYYELTYYYRFYILLRRALMWVAWTCQL